MANEVWTVDFKGWWHTRDGERCEPLTVRDEHTRYLLDIRAVESARTETIRMCFERIFRIYGLPEAIRSDNGPPFASNRSILGLTRLSAWWVALGIDLERGRPGKPQDNGGHERMHLDISNELQSCADADARAQQAAFDIWRKTFNEERPHESLGMAFPAEVYAKSPRAYLDSPADIDYPGMLRRKVHRTGVIGVDGIQIRLSTAFAGWSVGLQPIDPDRFEVYFAKLRIGTIELSSASFTGVASHPGETVCKPQQNYS
ncbi:integrase core domain-containing protein [Puniceicoccus vermicola]|uniref:Transposase n=1 Tax=Puniceicoccus vermicola TaxID=388746 RepID=A0A7X1B1Q3_9BACT|nr:DDE-type integrase/transposase/recombinase [Puniceicoccus vermicola]MBC2602908.1 transposase [Puniceicoccus vermicola]